MLPHERWFGPTEQTLRRNFFTGPFVQVRRRDRIFGMASAAPYERRECRERTGGRAFMGSATSNRCQPCLILQAHLQSA
jgi:hypothetical protein